MTASLLIGGAGFIGANLVEELLLAGHDCIIVDNDSGLGPVRSLPRQAKFILANASDLSKLNLKGIDFVFYLAGKCAGISFNRHHQKEMMLSNLQALSGIKYCFQLEPKRFIFFSTACVYPSWAPVPTSEVWGHWGLPERTNLGYGLAKRIGELIISSFYFKTGVPTLILRPSNTFGPRDFFDERYGHFVPSMLVKMLRGDPIIRVWGGKQTRSFVYVNDIVRIVMSLLNSSVANATVNIGHPQELTISEACQIIRQVAEYQGKIEYIPGPIGYNRRAANQNRLNTLVGPPCWTSFRDGLSRTITWMMTKEYTEWTRRLKCNTMEDII